MLVPKRVKHRREFRGKCAVKRKAERSSFR